MKNNSDILNRIIDNIENEEMQLIINFYSIF